MTHPFPQFALAGHCFIWLTVTQLFWNKKLSIMVPELSDQPGSQPHFKTSCARFASGCLVVAYIYMYNQTTTQPTAYMNKFKHRSDIPDSYFNYSLINYCTLGYV